MFVNRLKLGPDEFTLDDGVQVMAGQLSPQEDAAISLPASLFSSIVDREDVGIFFALYDSSTLFPVDGRNTTRRRAPRRAEVGSSVLAATVGPGLNFSMLSENVTVVFRLSTSFKVRISNHSISIDKDSLISYIQCLEILTVHGTRFRNVCFLEFYPPRLDH